MTGGVSKVVPIDSIIVGPRIRKDMGDIAGLASDIAGIDQLEPIVVRPFGPDRYELACGERRLRAAKRNGQADIHVIVRQLTDAEMRRAEFSENVFHKPFTPSEMVAIADAIEPDEREKAKARQGERTDKHSEKFSGSSGNALDKVAKVAGVSRPTLVKARAVVEAAAAEPEKYAKLLTAMDKTGRVHGPYKRLIVARQAEAIRAEPPPYPKRGPYRVIAADVPWPYEVRQEDVSHRATHPYPPMSIEQICAEASKVQAIAHDDCILLFWTTNYHMLNGTREVLDAWGFEPKTIITWVKDHFGYGDLAVGQTEHCILAVRGKPIVEIPPSTVIYAPRRANSQKPDRFFALVEKHYPAPRYAELFARSTRPNWDGHGNEIQRDNDGSAAEPVAPESWDQMWSRRFALTDSERGEIER